MREGLTLGRLRMMDPDAAAALLRYRQAEGVADAKLLADWLALDPANGFAWAAANACWSDLEAVGDDEILAALRADARGSTTD